MASVQTPRRHRLQGPTPTELPAGYLAPRTETWHAYRDAAMAIIRAKRPIPSAHRVIIFLLIAIEKFPLLVSSC